MPILPVNLELACVNHLMCLRIKRTDYKLPMPFDLRTLRL